MALLRHVKLGSTFRPASRCLVGRGPNCHWLQNHTSVSREHAVIFREGEGWWVRDLSSRNGTLVRGQRVRDTAALERGVVICFGDTDNAWELVEVDSPCARGTTAQGEVIVGTSSSLFLPGPEGAQACVSRQDKHWLLEWEGEVHEVKDGDEVSFSGRDFRLELPYGDDGVAE